MVSTRLPEAQNSSLQYLTPSPAADASPNQQLLPLTTRVNDRDRLEVGGCDVPELVQRFGSPLYILDEATLRSACRQYRESFATYPGASQVIYASKAWSCLAVCAIVHQEGLGLDVVSGGELLTALEAGVSPDKIYLHGNNKSRDELKLAVDAGCTVVADNWHDLKTLAEFEVAQPIRVMLRLTPGIECHTHEYIRTGSIDSKFGFDPNQIDAVFEFMQQPNLACIGLHAHIGSQTFELQPHHDLAAVMVQWFSKAAHLGLPVSELNIGGGLGIRYTESDDPPSIAEWVTVVAKAIAAAAGGGAGL